VVAGSLFINPSAQGLNLISGTFFGYWELFVAHFFLTTENYSDYRLEWAIGLVKLSREKAQTNWQIKMFGGKVCRNFHILLLGIYIWIYI
jgi:hypothetical protein